MEVQGIGEFVPFLQLAEASGALKVEKLDVEIRGAIQIVSNDDDIHGAFSCCLSGCPKNMTVTKWGCRVQPRQHPAEKTTHSLPPTPSRLVSGCSARYFALKSRSFMP
jgi:hypothetical protein